jgi:phosphomethylpyrimidine synthase
MTQIESARKGIVTPQMKEVIQQENIGEDELLTRLAAGSISIPANPNHKHLQPRGIGKGLKVKINATLLWI